MLTKEDNELISQVGPGTPMGSLMREYWVPAMLSSELAGPDSDPVRVMLLGEQLVGFRDTSGKVGLIANLCTHRGASLFFGRNEENGIRCVYHGWKFDIEGNCVDMPNEPPESNFKNRIKATAYPCQERNGLVWAYMGPREIPPPLPSFEGNMLPEGEWNVSAIQRECNYFQGLEGDIDTSHFSFLHAGSMDVSTQEPGTFSYYMLANRAPQYMTVDTDFGAMYGAYRNTGDGRRYWRVANFLFPFWTMPPQGVLGDKITARGWVPMDDTHTMFFMTGPKFRRPQPENDQLAGDGRSNDAAPRSAPMNRMLPEMDDFTGISGIHLQDQAITESEGPVFDRSQEHLAASDLMIIRTRNLLLDAARALADKGLTPPGVDHPEVFGARAGGVFLSEDVEDWLAATSELRRGFVKHPELDRAITGPLV
jgi:phenylpropionate dioxygenase-like ring-hydroxylating dioxygenase large terminal subunit